MKRHRLIVAVWLAALATGARPVRAQATPNITVGNVSGKPGDMVTVPVLLGQVSNISAASFTVDFSMSNPTGAPAVSLGMNGTLGALATGGLAASNAIGTQYKVALAAAITGMSQALISGPGTLFNIPVTIPVSAAPGTVYTVAVQAVDLEDSTPAMIPSVPGMGTLTVASPVASVQVTPNPAMVAVGGTLPFTAAALDSGMKPISGAVIAWTVAAGGTANVSIDATSGVLTANSPGTATVQATASGITGTSVVTVNPGPPASVVLSPAMPTVTAGATQQFTAVVKDSLGNTIQNAGVSWTADAAIGAIAGSGLFTAGTAGSGKVTATAGMASAFTTITVTPGAPATVTVAPGTISLPNGTTQQFTATAKDAEGNVIPSPTFTWSVDAAVGSIDAAQGILTAAGPSSGNVTATVGAISGAAHVTVAGPPALSVGALAGGQWVRGVLSLTPTIANLTPSSVQVTADGAATALSTATAAPFVLTLDTTKLPDGPHSLTFVALGAASQMAQATVNVNVLNGQPTATISAPAPSKKVRGVVSVTGTAVSAIASGFSNYALAAAPGDTTANAVPIGAAATVAVTMGALGPWDTSALTPGQYTLILTVTDLAGNQTQAHELVNVIPFVLGDLNGDGKVSIPDATLAVRIAIGAVTPTPDQIAVGDLRHQGAITIADATQILLAAVGLKVLM